MRGASISLKLIVATSALLILVITGFAVLNSLKVRSVYEQTAETTAASIKQQVNKVGIATVMTAAASTRTYFEQSNDLDMRNYVAQLAAQNADLAMVYVVDQDFGLVAHSDASKNPSQGHPPVQEPSWAVVKARWEALAEQPDAGAMVSFLEFDDAGHPLALFALPVFPPSIDTPTARAAIDPEVGETPYGYVVIGSSLQPLHRALDVLHDRKRAAYQALLAETALLGLFFVLLGVLLAILHGLRMSRPIRQLADRAEALAQGDLDARVHVSSRDEIGLLGRNFNHMAEQLSILISETSRRASLEKELDLAREIQQRLVPREDVIARPGLSLAAFFDPAEACGGDWWTFHELGAERVLLVVGDVTGHGVPSAMITTSAKAACDAARNAGGRVDCVQMATTLNHAVYEATKGELMMTAFVAIVDLPRREISWVNAGHNFPLLVRPGAPGVSAGAADGPQISCLTPGGTPLGLRSDASWQPKSRVLEPGDTLLLFTDGLVECENERGEMYGERRLRKLLLAGSEATPRALRDELVAAARSFYGDVPHKDDVTFMVVKLG